MFERFWFSRHYVALSTLSSVIIGVGSPGSLNARALAANGLAGWVLVGLLAGLALVILLDAALSAFCPARRIDALRRNRHTLLMLLAICHLSMGFLIVAFAPASAALVVRFGLDATAAALLAFFDLFQRHAADRRCSM